MNSYKTSELFHALNPHYRQQHIPNAGSHSTPDVPDHGDTDHSHTNFADALPFTTMEDHDSVNPAHHGTTNTFAPDYPEHTATNPPHPQPGSFGNALPPTGGDDLGFRNFTQPGIQGSIAYNSPSAFAPGPGHFGNIGPQYSQPRNLEGAPLTGIEDLGSRGPAQLLIPSVGHPGNIALQHPQPRSGFGDGYAVQNSTSRDYSEYQPSVSTRQTLYNHYGDSAQPSNVSPQRSQLRDEAGGVFTVALPSSVMQDAQHHVHSARRVPYDYGDTMATSIIPTKSHRIGPQHRQLIGNLPDTPEDNESQYRLDSSDDDDDNPREPAFAFSLQDSVLARKIGPKTWAPEPSITTLSSIPDIEAASAPDAGAMPTRKAVAKRKIPPTQAKGPQKKSTKGKTKSTEEEEVKDPLSPKHAHPEFVLVIFLTGTMETGPLANEAEKLRFQRYFKKFDVTYEGVSQKKQFYLEQMYDLAIDVIGSLRFNSYDLRECGPKQRIEGAEQLMQSDLYAHAIDPTNETLSEDEDSKGEDYGKGKAKAKAKETEAKEKANLEGRLAQDLESDTKSNYEDGKIYSSSEPFAQSRHRGLMETVLEMISLFPPQVVIYVLEEVLSDPKHLLHAFTVPTTLLHLGASDLLRTKAKIPLSKKIGLGVFQDFATVFNNKAHRVNDRITSISGNGQDESGTMLHLAKVLRHCALHYAKKSLRAQRAHESYLNDPYHPGLHYYNQVLSKMSAKDKALFFPTRPPKDDRASP